MNLFDFTYCGNYNRQIQNLARISPEKWSFGQSGDNGILKGYLENTFRRLYEEGKVREESCKPWRCVICRASWRGSCCEWILSVGESGR